MSDPGLSDCAAAVALDGPEDRGGGKYRYERYRVTAGGQTVERDVVRVGPVVVVIPVDLNRGEVVMLRQFRLGAHLAIGRGEQVELPAGHVEAGEAAIDAARRECLEEIGVAPAGAVVRHAAVARHVRRAPDVFSRRGRRGESR